MNQQDMLFLVLIAIGSTSLIVILVQAFRSRNGKSNGGNWWEGPWDEDDKKR